MGARNSILLSLGNASRVFEERSIPGSAKRGRPRWVQPSPRICGRKRDGLFTAGCPRLTQLCFSDSTPGSTGLLLIAGSDRAHTNPDREYTWQNLFDKLGNSCFLRTGAGLLRNHRQGVLTRHDFCTEAIDQGWSWKVNGE